MSTLTVRYRASAIEKIRRAGHVVGEPCVSFVATQTYRLTPFGVEPDEVVLGDPVAWANAKYPGAELQWMDFEPAHQ